MTTPQEQNVPTRQDLLGKPDLWTGEALVSVYEVDVEYAVYEHITANDQNTWITWQEEHPELLNEIVGEIRQRLGDNLVIDARLDEYVVNVIKELSAPSDS